MTRLPSPLKWYGGKGALAPWVVSHFPSHAVYVEAFGGGASCLFAKRPAPVEVYNDVHGGAVNLFRVLRNEEQAGRLIRALELTPYARDEWRDGSDSWAEEPDPVEKARKFFTACRQGFGGTHDQAWGYCRISRLGLSAAVSGWLGAVEALPAVIERLRGVLIEHRDFRTILRAWDGPDTLFYLDPPYVGPERSDSRGYANELTEVDHQEMVAILLGLEGMVVLSGYDTPLYAPLEAAGWRVAANETFARTTATTRANGLLGQGALKNHRRVERLWISPAGAAALHPALPLWAEEPDDERVVSQMDLPELT